MDTQEYQELRGMISQISEQFKAPLFTPHITLAALPATIEIDKVDIAFKKLLEGIEAESIRLDSVRQGNTYYQSVFAHVHPISTQRLQEMQKYLYGVLGVSPPHTLPEFAHLSLYYGADAEEKTLIVRTASGMKVFNESVRVPLGSLWLVDPTGPVPDWKASLKVDANQNEG
jgi:hypothetical protein